MLFTRFARNRDGGVAPLLAIAALPLLAATGAAIDYSRASATRTSLQAALDATGLMLSQEAATTAAADLGSKANTYFTALFNRPDAQNVSLTHEFTSPQQGSFVLKLTASTDVPMIFASILGQSQIPVGVTSEVLWGMKKLNLALALDNTGSMASSGKMTALKAAAHNLLNTLQAAEKVPGDIKVSIVPFATDVNVGTQNVSSDWIDWSEWEAKNGTCSKSSYSSSQSNCTSNGGAWTPKNHSTWNGCVWDRDQNYDVQNTAPAGTAATKFRAHQASNCSVSMLPLTQTWSDLHGKIDAMTPAGNTNVTIGLAWAWQTLSPVEPLNAPTPQPDLDKVIILLTDGQNTQNRWTSSTSSIDTRTQKVCDNAKADNIKIYTVRVIDGNGTLLKNCATKPDMYYDVEEADQLNVVFKSIAQNLANLRIAK
jgi:Flp pilus assembly protein TadG